MDRLTRRRAIALGIVSGSSLLATSASATNEELIPAGEGTRFIIEDMTIDRFDDTKKTLTMSIGNRVRPSKLVDIPVTDFNFYEQPAQLGFPAYLPPEEYWARVRKELGKRIGVQFRAAPDGLSVVGIVNNKFD